MPFGLGVDTSDVDTPLGWSPPVMVLVANVRLQLPAHIHQQISLVSQKYQQYSVLFAVFFAMPWNDRIDAAIISEVYDTGTVTSGNLKRGTEHKLKKEISTDVFSRHIQQLTMNRNNRYAVSPVLDKKDYGRGKKVIYSLTRKASVRYRLKLPILKLDLESNREIAYQLLFMYIKNPDVSRFSEDDIEKYTFNGEEEFDSFLSKIHVRREDLQIIEKEGWKKKDSNGNIIYRYTNLVEPNKNIQIGKTEYPQENKCSYICALPGISINDFTKGTKTGMPFEHIHFTKREIEKAFNLLEQEGLISKVRSPVLELLNEGTRYDVTDERLREFIKCCWIKLFSDTTIRMMLGWKNNSKPRQEEKNWYKIFWGQKRANIHFAIYHNNLKSLKKVSMIQRHSTTENKTAMLEAFNRLNDEYRDVIEKYPYPSAMLLDLVYPHFLRESYLRTKASTS
jgi:hypothetical protein